MMAQAISTTAATVAIIAVLRITSCATAAEKARMPAGSPRASKDSAVDVKNLPHDVAAAGINPP